MFRSLRTVAAVVVVWVLVGWGLYEIRGSWETAAGLVAGAVLGLVGLFVSGRIKRYVGGVLVAVVLCGVAVGVATAVSALVGADPKMSAFLGFVGFFCVGVTGEAIKYWRRRRRTRT